MTHFGEPADQGLLSRNLSAGKTDIGTNIGKPGFYIPVLLVVYFLSWGLVWLAPESVYWDDWWISQNEAFRLREAFSQGGVPLQGVFFAELNRFGPQFYLFLSFTSLFLVGLLWHKILHFIPGTTPATRLLGALFLLTTPIYAARFLVAVSPYNFGLLLFCLAWYLAVRKARWQWWETASIVVLLLTSYVAFQLLLFTGVIIGHAALVRIRAGFGFTTLKVFLLLLVPPSYFAISRALFPRRDQFAQVYNIDISNLVLLVFVLTFLSAFTAFVMQRAPINEQVLARGFFLLLMSFILLLAGAAPYWATSKSLTQTGLLSRNHFLIGFGLSLLGVTIALVAKKLIGRKLALWLVFVLLTLFTWLNIQTCLDYVRDWKKQQAVIRLLESSLAIQEAELIFFTDEARHWNMLGRHYTWFEWNLMMNRAFGDETRFGVSDSFELKEYLRGDLDPAFNKDSSLLKGATDHRTPSSALHVAIRPTGPPRDFFSPERLKIDIIDVVSPQDLPLDLPRDYSTA